MTDSFFGFNNAITGFEEGLHDDPGQGLDEEAEEYDALNDETFGADSLDGDWEQDHEKLAQITERSRVHTSSFNSATDEPPDDPREPDYDGADYDEADDGFGDLNLEASLSQLVTDDDELLVENKKPKTHRNVNRMGAGVLEGGYSCSPPSQVNVWGVQRQDQQHALKPHNNLQPTKKYCTVEELERTLKQSSGMVNNNNQKKVPSAVRLEDLERDLTSNKHKVPPGFTRPPMFPHGTPPHQEQLRNNGVPPGFGHHQHRDNMAAMRGGQYAVPPPQIMLPPGLDFRHRPMGPGPNMLRFLPPHLMMAAQQHFQPRPNFRQPYQQGGPMQRGIHARGMPVMRYPGPRPPRENGDFRDEYDGLMTEREVQWLLNIQQININTAQPYVDDFYFTVFTARHPKQPHGDRRRTRERRDSHRDPRTTEPSQPGRVYTPLQFENSLGKLQCGSVTAPRKIIDMDVVSNEVADPTVAQTSQRDTRRAKQLLLTIEQLYLVLLKLEDLDCPLATTPEVTDPPTVPEDKPSLVQRLTAGLSVEDRLHAAMCVRKGKDLVARLLPHLSPSSSEQDASWLAGLWATLFRGLIPIGRRDGDAGTLARFYPHLKRWLGTAELPALEGAAGALRTAPPARNTLAYALANKFGVSVCCALLARADQLSESVQSPEWRAFVRDLSDAAASVPSPTPGPRPTPLEPVDGTVLGQHLDRSGVGPSPALVAILSAVDSS